MDDFSLMTMPCQSWRTITPEQHMDMVLSLNTEVPGHITITDNSELPAEQSTEGCERHRPLFDLNTSYEKACYGWMDNRCCLDGSQYSSRNLNNFTTMSYPESNAPDLFQMYYTYAPDLQVPWTSQSEIAVAPIIGANTYSPDLLVPWITQSEIAAAPIIGANTYAPDLLVPWITQGEIAVAPTIGANTYSPDLLVPWITQSEIAAAPIIGANTYAPDLLVPWITQGEIAVAPTIGANTYAPDLLVPWTTQSEIAVAPIIGANTYAPDLLVPWTTQSEIAVAPIIGANTYAPDLLVPWTTQSEIAVAPITEANTYDADLLVPWTTQSEISVAPITEANTYAPDLADPWTTKSEIAVAPIIVATSSGFQEADISTLQIGGTNLSFEKETENTIPHYGYKEAIHCQEHNSIPVTKKTAKRRKLNTDLNEESTQKVRRKTHRPKIDDGKSNKQVRKTQKTKAPSHSTAHSLGKRKYVKKTKTEDVKQGSTNSLATSTLTCRRALKFVMETHSMDRELTIIDDISSSHPHNLVEIIKENPLQPQLHNVEGMNLNFKFGTLELGTALQEQQRREPIIIEDIPSSHPHNLVERVKKIPLEPQLHNVEGMNLNFKFGNLKLGATLPEQQRREWGTLQEYHWKLKPNFPHSLKRKRIFRKKNFKRAQRLKSSILGSKLLEVCHQLDGAELIRLIPKGMRRYIISNQKSFLCPLTLCNSSLPVSRRKRSWNFIKLHDETFFRVNHAREQISEYRKEGNDLSFTSKSCIEISIHAGGDEKQQKDKEHFYVEDRKMEIQDGCSDGDEKQQKDKKHFYVEDRKTETQNRCSDGDEKQQKDEEHSYVEYRKMEPQEGCGYGDEKQQKDEEHFYVEDRKMECQAGCGDQGHALAEIIHIDNGGGLKDSSPADFLVNDEHVIIPFVKKLKKYEAKVDIDPVSERMWELSLCKDINKGEKEKMSPEEIKELDLFHQRVYSFIQRMHLMQGDRRFSRWKGSVLDSVMGVFLTPNVSDKLSSNAYMSLGAHFPVIQSSSNLETSNENLEADRQTSSESVGSTNNETHKSPSDVVKKQATNTVEDLIQANTLTSPKDTANLFSFQDQVETSPRKNLEESGCNFCLQEGGPPYSDLKALESDKETGNEKRQIEPDMHHSETKLDKIPKPNKGKGKKTEDKGIDGRTLRATYSNGEQGRRSDDTLDSVDWTSVRGATLEKIAAVISKRGMHNQIAKRIKDFLNKIVETHGDLNLEWLRNVPGNIAKEYLLSFGGLGLKSVECIRLLSLQHHAFPVDTNVGRVVVRLGWVPLKPLPESLQFHLLEQFPIMDEIQKYLWPRLRHLDQQTLYELHYQMITFGKVFCTKRNPNCQACPMKDNCKHFASACARERFSLPSSSNKETMTPMDLVANPLVPVANPLDQVANPYSSLLLLPTSNEFLIQCETKSSEPIIEEPSTPEYQQGECGYAELMDIEDIGLQIPVIDLTIHQSLPGPKPVLVSDELSNEFQEVQYTVKSLGPNKEESSILEPSKGLAVLSREAASKSLPKQKEVGRLKTEHQVYELPDDHPLLEKMQVDKREPCDPGKYLIAIWTMGEQGVTEKKNEEEEEESIPSTLLIPCRTALRGRFPLNATYFQVNEVFADHETMRSPVKVPRRWFLGLKRRTLYCGVTTSSLFRGSTTEEIIKCFWAGYVCVRGFDRKTRLPTNLSKRFHEPPKSGRKEELYEE